MEIDDNFFEEVEGIIKEGIREKKLIKPEDLQEILRGYKNHIEAERSKSFKERELYKDKYGAHVIIVKAPAPIMHVVERVDKETGEKKKFRVPKNQPKKTGNNNFFLNDYNIPFLGQYNKLKYFAESVKDFVPYSKQVLVRGTITIKYKYKQSEDYAKPLPEFLKEMREVYKVIKPDVEVKGLGDVNIDDYWKDYTFNHWETLAIKGETK
jgi:hypothetical protein